MDLRDRITLDPDPYWPDRFETERDRIREVAPEGLRGVYHVGSTAIPDVPGKPALDVLAVYADADALTAAAEALAAAAAYERAAPTVIARWEDDGAVFLRLHTPDEKAVREQLLFREYLREHPEARERYARVKREAAAAHPEDPQAYTAAKADVVAAILADAREAGYEDRLPADV